ncbi:MAG: hypothetical protein KGY99_04760 [Phycisphaerae bacterium]|nr:hypothetical protein [Phycisphaerae bacterium]
MVYAAFTVWFVLILFAGVGVYRMWTSLTRPAYVHWALLPGTVVSEMAYIFGCLITGGEIRRARIIDLPGKDKRSTSEPTTDAAAGIKVVGPVLASVLSIVACIGAVLAAHALLGEPVVGQFMQGPLSAGDELPKTLPTSWSQLWDHVHVHVTLLRRMFEALGDFAWRTWTGPLFVYLAACLSVRLSPVTRPMRPTLAAVVVVAGGIALAGAISERFGWLLQKSAWPLLTYVWANLLVLLTITLLARGLVALGRILAGKADKASR